MVNVFDYIPMASDTELAYLKKAFDNMSAEDAERFTAVYSPQRRDYTLMLVLTIIGFFGLGGLQRLAVNQIGMGVLYILTFGLCYIGTIVDLINLKDITNNYNTEVARNILNNLKRQ